MTVAWPRPARTTSLARRARPAPVQGGAEPAAAPADAESSDAEGPAPGTAGPAAGDADATATSAQVPRDEDAEVAALLGRPAAGER